MVVAEDAPEPVSRLDAGVVAALRAGDECVFRELVGELSPGLVRLARTYVTAELADEVVQETWIAVIRHIDSFEGRSSLSTWVYRILLNKVRNLAKREARSVPFAAMGHTGRGDEPAVDPDRLAHPVDGPGHWTEVPTRWQNPTAGPLESAEVLAVIEGAISRLPVGQREVIELRDIQGRSAEDVCQILGVSSVNQRVLLHRARVKVRAAIEEYLNDG